MKPIYRHTQYGILMFAVFLIVGVLIMLVAQAIIAEGRLTAAFILIILTIFFIALFYASTIELSARYIKFWFGIGLIRKTIPLSDIQSTRQVVNPWYYFWGIKSIPGGWFYAIAPGPALEIILKNKKVIHIGTDQPAELRKAIDSARQSSG